MKFSTINSQHGFAHPLLLAFLVVSVVSVVGFSGYRVMKKNSTTVLQNTAAPQGQIVIAKQSIGAETAPTTAQATAGAEQISIKSPGSAATVSTATVSGSASVPTNQTGKIKLSSQYDVSTPIGSLSQLIYEAQQGDYGNALYFVTPQFVSSAYNSVGAQNYSQFINNCQTNEACKMLASTDVSFDLSHITETTCTPPSGSGFTECKKVGTKFVIENNSLKTVYYKTVGYHVHEASVTMLRAENSTNWVINQVTVDSFTL